MDFILVMPGGVRIVIEVDGKQHYATRTRSEHGDTWTASAELYAEMMTEDRSLRLKGYEVYRFGGLELMKPSAPEMLRSFFEELDNLYGRRPS
jgi:very-short-patch-repair endonuclease